MAPSGKPDWYPDWTGETCIIVASGPSASEVNLESAKGKARFIVINSSWPLAPWADVLYGCDSAFWSAYKAVPEFAGLKVTQDAKAGQRWANVVQRVVCDRKRDDLIFDPPGTIGWGGNSGFQAINLAAQFGASKIILVGFDMRLDRGMHWHGDHPAHMNNPKERNVDRWRRAVDGAFHSLKKRGIEAFNISKVSALTQYPKVDFATALNEPSRMRVLVLGPEVKALSEVQNFSGVFSYYLRRELTARNVTLRFMPKPDKWHALDFYRALDLSDTDHVLAFGSRHFERIDPECYRVVSRRIKGAVSQLNDRSIRRPLADVSFIVKGVNDRKHKVIGWAADPELWKPQQKADTLRILIDHPDYVEDRGDISGQVLEQVQAFASSVIWAKRFRQVQVVRWLDGGFRETTEAVNGFTRQHIPYEEVCRECSRAHLFMVTHPESVGLSVVETAMAGALPIVPKGFMDRELLKTVRHIEYDGAIPWELVLKKIDPNMSRQRALQNRWGSVADKIVSGLKEFRK